MSLQNDAVADWEKNLMSKAENGQEYLDKMSDKIEATLLKNWFSRLFIPFFAALFFMAVALALFAVVDRFFFEMPLWGLVVIFVVTLGLLWIEVRPYYRVARISLKLLEFRKADEIFYVVVDEDQNVKATTYNHPYFDAIDGGGTRSKNWILVKKNRVVEFNFTLQEEKKDDKKVVRGEAIVERVDELMAEYSEITDILDHSTRLEKILSQKIKELYLTSNEDTEKVIEKLSENSRLEQSAFRVKPDSVQFQVP